MPSYILRQLDPQMWAEFKARAEREGHPLKWVILRLIRRYIDQGL